VKPLIPITFSLLLAGISASRGEEVSRQTERILQDMKAQGRAFNPSELIASGEEGLAEILDFLMPESAGHRALNNEEIESLIEDLGHEQFFRRKNAIAKLSSSGEEISERMEMLSASMDPEVAKNATEVLKGILNPPGKTKIMRNVRHTEEYGQAYGSYLEKLEDRACWSLIAVRTTQALFLGRDSTGSTDDLMWQSFTIMASKAQDDAMTMFRPLIHLRNVSLCRWVFTHLYVRSPKGFTPSILREIVGSDHIYSEAHLLRRLQHLREKGADIPYEPDPKEVLGALDALRKDPSIYTTQNFLSYEEDALNLLYSLPEIDRGVAIKAGGTACTGTLVITDSKRKRLSVNTGGAVTRDFPIKDVSLFRFLPK